MSAISTLLTALARRILSTSTNWYSKDWAKDGWRQLPLTVLAIDAASSLCRALRTNSSALQLCTWTAKDRIRIRASITDTPTERSIASSRLSLVRPSNWSRFNQADTLKPFEDCPPGELSRNHPGWEGRALYVLALALFRKSTGFPSLEVLAYGDFSDPVVEHLACLLVVKDILVPAGCTVISSSELEPRTTVKSPMSFLAAFNMRPKPFWV